MVGCSMPAMQRQERHGHQELIAALTVYCVTLRLSYALIVTLCYSVVSSVMVVEDDLPYRLSDERIQRDMAALIH